MSGSRFIGLVGHPGSPLTVTGHIVVTCINGVVKIPPALDYPTVPTGADEYS